MEIKVKLEKNHNGTWELFNDETNLWLATIEQHENNLWYEVGGTVGFEKLSMLAAFLSPNKEV